MFLLCRTNEIPCRAFGFRKVNIKVFDKLTGGKRESDRVHQDGDESIELQLLPGDAYEMDGVRETIAYFCSSNDRIGYG